VSPTVTAMKGRARRFVDRLAAPYVEAVVERVNATAATGGDAVAADPLAVRPNGTSDAFHAALHELRTIELERVPKGARRALSVGAQGRWYFDWFERSVGVVDEHVGVEAYEPRPDDLPPYATWVADTADQMVGVADASIDLVFAGQTSEHLWAHELAGFLAEAHRVLRADGVLALDSPNRLITEHLHWSHGGHTIEISAAEMHTLLGLAGFEVLSTAGLWNCVLDGRVWQLEEGIEQSAVLTRRAATAHDRPDDAFVWWINARRLDIGPDRPALDTAVADLFARHWNTRVCRGLFPTPGATALDLQPGASGMQGQTLPFLLHAGDWTITATLADGTWADLDGFALQIVAPGGVLVHDLPLSAAEVDGTRATFRFHRPELVFALAIEVHVGRVDRPCRLALPLDVRSHD